MEFRFDPDVRDHLRYSHGIEVEEIGRYVPNGDADVEVRERIEVALDRAHAARATGWHTWEHRADRGVLTPNHTHEEGSR